MKPPRNVSGSALESVSDRHRAGPPDPGTAGIAHVRILFDQGVPVPLRKHLSEYAVDTTFERGWSTLDNGAPLNSAEADGHKILITDDQNLRHQENLAEGRLAIVVLPAASWPGIRGRVEAIRAAVDQAIPGNYIEVRV